MTTRRARPETATTDPLDQSLRGMRGFFGDADRLLPGLFPRLPEPVGRGLVPITIEDHFWSRDYPDVRQAFARIRLAPMPGLGEVVVSRGDDAHTIKLQVQNDVFDRVTGKPTRVSLVEAVHLMMLQCPTYDETERTVARVVRQAIERVYLHEIEECLRWDDGSHVRDPHAVERTR
jgi:hypothetical protein